MNKFWPRHLHSPIFKAQGKQKPPAHSETLLPCTLTLPFNRGTAIAAAIFTLLEAPQTWFSLVSFPLSSTTLAYYERSTETTKQQEKEDLLAGSSSMLLQYASQCLPHVGSQRKGVTPRKHLLPLTATPACLPSEGSCRQIPGCWHSYQAQARESNV